MSKALVKHKVHKYYKARVGKMIVYRCALPDCSHYLRKELVTNHMSLCFRCNQPFMLPKAPSLLKAKPWCDECEKTRKAKQSEVEIPDELMKKILGGL